MIATSRRILSTHYCRTTLHYQNLWGRGGRKIFRLFSSSSTVDKKRVVWDFPASDAKEEQKRGVLYSADNETGDQWITHARSKKKEQSITTARSLQSLAKENLSHLLPARYPYSVAPGYLQFATFSFAASIAGSAAMVLSTQTLLLAVGVVGSSQKAGVMAGAFNWVMKDFVGQLGGVLFASQMGKTRAFDSDPKRWRMVAAMALDCAAFVEIISPMVPISLVLPVASVANIAKNIGFLTVSASRAALHQSLATKGNLGDVTAKAGSQAILASLIGTSVGIGLSSVLAHDTYSFALGFLLLTVIHEGCNFLSLQSIPLTYFNRQRLHLVLEHYLETNQVASPLEIANKEKYFPLQPSNTTKSWLSIGSPLQKICPTPSNLNSALEAIPNEEYLIRIGKGRIYLVFLKDASGQDIIRGMFHACLIRRSLEEKGRESSCLYDDLVKVTHLQVKGKFLSLLEQMEGTGWRTGTEFTTVESSNAHRICIEKL